MSDHKSEFELANSNDYPQENQTSEQSNDADNITVNTSVNSGASAEKQTANVENTPPAPLKGIDLFFTLEHQGMIAAKYRAKYSDLEQVSHKQVWPEFKGNHFMMYVLAETLSEARKAVFSANRSILINQLVGAMVNYTPHESTDKNGNSLAMTELQILFNKATDQQLNALTEQLSDESNRTDVLKAYAKTLKQSARTGRDIDAARLKFYHAADILGVVAGTIW